MRCSLVVYFLRVQACGFLGGPRVGGVVDGKVGRKRAQTEFVDIG